MIRKLEIFEISKLYPLADSFFTASRFLKDFNRDHFTLQWESFIKNDIGVILGQFRQNEIIGGLGGIKFTDPNNGQWVASEMFWYVLPDHRGTGVRLLDSFEKWAIQNDCKNITVAYLTDSMPDIVRDIYEYRGYKAMEVHYLKELLKEVQ